MRSGVTSATDHFELKHLGPEALRRLSRRKCEHANDPVRASRWKTSFAFATSGSRSLRSGVVWRSSPPAKKKPDYPWIVTLKPNVLRRFEVCLGDGVCQSMRDSFSAAAPYRVETGGFLFGN